MYGNHNQTFTTKKRQQLEQMPAENEDDDHHSIQSDYESVESEIEINYSSDEEPENWDQGKDEERQKQQLVEQQQFANYTDKLNNWSFNTADHQVDAIVERMRSEFCKEVDQVRKTMNAQIQQLKKENAALKKQLNAQIGFMRMDVRDNKENEDAQIAAIQDEIAKLRVNEKAPAREDQRVDAKKSLVDLSKNYWNTRDYQNPSVNGRTVSSCIAGGYYDAIRTMFGYSTSMLAVPNNSAHNFKICYAEFMVLAMPEGKFIFIGLAPSSFPVRKILGSQPNTYSINKKGTLRCAGDVKSGFVPNGFGPGDTIGCGLVMTKCATQCDPCRLFFAKNGQILGPPLAISPTCSELFPTISFHGAGSKVCANFGNEPFKYAIPPAKGLLCGVGGFCCCCEKN